MLDNLMVLIQAPVLNIQLLLDGVFYIVFGTLVVFYRGYGATGTVGNPWERGGEFRNVQGVPPGNEFLSLRGIYKGGRLQSALCGLGDW